MNPLSKPFDEITFQDIEDFCAEQHIETTTLDYKKNVPRDLSKHIAALSNTLGGLIIIGIEEDSQTGLPIKWEGIEDKNKPIDQVYAFVANVKPYPSCQVRSTDKKNGKLFVLLEVLEGDVPPYYSVKDPSTVWLRTGNISTPLKPAERDAIELMYGKRERAATARMASLGGADEVLAGALKIAEQERGANAAAGRDVYAEDLTSKVGDALKISLQLYYPHRNLVPARQIKDRLHEFRVTSHPDFPMLNLRATQGGVYGSDIRIRTGKIVCHQLYANGLLWHFSDDIVQIRSDRPQLLVSDVTYYLYSFLKSAQGFYRTFNYHGLLVGDLALKGIGQAMAHQLVPNGYHYFGDGAVVVKSNVQWPLELDTHIIGDESLLQDYFVELLERIYWDLGIEQQGAAAIIRTWLDQAELSFARK